jgi:hypothetical protein
MRLRHALRLPRCAGVDHMDFTASGHLALVSCEFAGRLVVVDLRRERARRTIALRRGAMPQDVKLAPDGRTFDVADMASGGVWLVDARRLHRPAVAASARRARPARRASGRSPAATRSGTPASCADRRTGLTCLRASLATNQPPATSRRTKAVNATASAGMAYAA